MFLKNKKLRGMSLVELLAYTVILSILITSLFQLIHFIQDMNDKDLKQQETYSEFNLVLLKLDGFVSETPPSELVVNDSCMENSKQSFYFVQNSLPGSYTLCNTQHPLCSSMPQSCPTNERISKAPIFKIDVGRNFFSLLSPPSDRYKGVIYNFYLSEPNLKMDFTSFTEYQ